MRKERQITTTPLHYYVLTRKTSFGIQCMKCTQIYFYPNKRTIFFVERPRTNSVYSVYVHSGNTHTTRQTHNPKKKLIIFLFNPLAICKKNCGSATARVHHSNGYYGFDYYHCHWGYITIVARKILCIIRLQYNFFIVVFRLCMIAGFLFVK